MTLTVEWLKDVFLLAQYSGEKNWPRRTRQRRSRVFPTRWQKNAPHELRRGGTDYEDNVWFISRNLVIGTNCTLLMNSVVSLVFMVLVGLVLASVVGLRPCGCLGFRLFLLDFGFYPNSVCCYL